MTKSIKPSLLLVVYVLVIVCSWTPLSHSAKKPVGVARKEDIPYIKCQVCEKLASQVYHQVEAKRAEISPKKVTFFYLGFSHCSLISAYSCLIFSSDELVFAVLCIIFVFFLPVNP